MSERGFAEDRVLALADRIRFHVRGFNLPATIDRRDVEQETLLAFIRSGRVEAPDEIIRFRIVDSLRKLGAGSRYTDPPVFVGADDLHGSSCQQPEVEFERKPRTALVELRMAFEEHGCTGWTQEFEATVAAILQATREQRPTSAEAVMAWVASNQGEPSTQDAIAADCGLGREAVSRAIGGLLEEGRIHRDGKPARYWLVS